MNFPNQGYQPQQQGYQQQGYGQQPQQPAPQPVTQSAEEWFAESAKHSGGGAPSFKFDQVGDTVQGEILDMEGRQRTKMEDGSLLFFPDGQPQMQLVVTLQTNLRNWQQVSNIPTVKDQNGNAVPLPPDQDDGKRRVYIWYTLKEAFMAALQQAGMTSPKPGDLLAVRVSGTRPNPKVPNGKPSKLYEVQIRPGSPAAAAFVAQEQAQQGYQQQGQQQAPPPPAQQGYQQPPQQGYQPGPQQAPPPPTQQGYQQQVQQPPQQAQPDPWGAAGDPPF